jgi:hypothetical protein
MMSGSSDVILPSTSAEAEEVFALHWAATLLGSETLARLIPSKDSANNDFSVYWRSSSEPLGGTSTAHGGSDASSQCYYVDITIQFQKKLSPNNSNTTSVVMNVQFGSLWKQQSSSPQEEDRFLYTVLRADPSVSSNHPPWFAQLRRNHFQSLGIDVAATPGPVLARLWGRAWREWTPEQAAWKDHAPCVYLRYPPEFARSRVPFLLYDTESTKKNTDPNRIPGRLECETVPVHMAESILLLHRQQSLVLPQASDASIPDASTIVESTVPSDESKQTTSCWDLYQQWKKQVLPSPDAMNPTAAVAEIASTEATQMADTTSSEPTPAAPPAAGMSTADTTTTAASAGPNAKRRRIVRPNAPRRPPLPSARPPGNRFV